MSKPSPGPWSLRRMGNNPANRIDGVYAADGTKVCTFVGQTGHKSALRNGPALAAAPELLEALKQLELMLSANDTDFAAINSASPDYDPEYRPEWSKETLLCRAAIAKAEGSK